MKKIFSKKFWAALISMPIIAGGIVLACAGGWGPEEYGTSSFTPEAFVDSVYRPFFYSEMFYYYGIGHDADHNKRFNELNVAEWTGWLENKIPAADIEYILLYEDLPAIDSAAAYMGGKLKVLPPSLRSSKLFAAKNKKAEDFIMYLALAKKSEEFALNDLDHWYDEPKKRPPFNASKLNAALLLQFNNAKDVFLKQRYWFQLVRSYFFNSPAQNAIDLFEKNKDNFPKNKLYYRTMAYAAGGYYKQKNYSKANYYYSRVYDGCNELKTVAHYSFHPQEEQDWKATLAMCQNKDEQATLWQMLGVFYQDEKRAISEIYNLNPKSEKLDLLLARAVNKQEEKSIEWRENIVKGRVQFVNEPLDAELVALINKIAASSNTAKPAIWYTAAGYLAMLGKDYTKAQAQYALADKVATKDKMQQAQLRLLKIVNKIAAANRIDTGLESELLPELTWLTTPDETPCSAIRFANAWEWILNIMALRYNNQKEWVKAECFHSNAKFYTSNANVEAMKAFIDKPNKTPYEAICASLYVKKKDDLILYQAVRLTFDDKLQEAIAKTEQVPNAELELLGNPFNGRILDCHDCDHEAPQKIKYTRISMLRKMKEMEEKITANEDVYNNAVLLANAFYNITHYGNARYFYEGKILGEGHWSPFAIDSVFMGLLTDMKLPIKYYTTALQAAKTDEQKAKCRYMLAKCERNEWYNVKVYSNSDNEYGYNGPDFKAWENFKALQQYSNTQYYKDVIKECGYFRTYINK